MGVTLHLFSEQPLYDRAVAFGGSCVTRPPLPPIVHETVYQQVVTALGLDEMSSEDRINALVTLSVDEVITKLPPSVQFNACIDGDLVGSPLSYAAVADPNDPTLPGKKWCKALAIGDCGFDVKHILLPHGDSF